MLLPKNKRLTDREFLRWAKEQGGVCCLCLRLHGKIVYADHVHHFGEKGMGQKCSDYEVTRLCAACHERVQGKRRAYFSRTNEWEVLAAMQEDTIALLVGWIARES